MADFENSIVAYFGGDTTGLSASAIQADSILADLRNKVASKSLDAMAYQEKYAQGGIKAVVDIGAAEDKLNSFREKAMFSQMSNEQKLAILRSQATAILDRIGNIEGNTVEKLGLQLEYEKKKGEIFTLNSKEIQSQNKDHQETSGLMGKVEEGAQSIKRALKDMGLSLKGIGIGIIFAEFIKLGKEAIENTVKQNQEFRLLGKEVSASSASIEYFWNGLKGIKDTAISAVGSVIGFFTQLGAANGSVLNSMMGISKETEKQRENLQRTADISVARAKALKLENADIEKIAAAEKDLAKFRREQIIKRSSEEDQFKSIANEMNALLTERYNLEEKINRGGATGLKLLSLKKELEEKITAIHELGVRQDEERSKKFDQNLEFLKKSAEYENKKAEALAEYYKVEKLTEQDKAEASLLEMKSKIKLTSQESLRLQILNLQASAMTKVAEIQEILSLPAEERNTKQNKERLTLLESQLKKIVEQIDAKKKLIEVNGGVVKTENDIKDAIEKQYVTSLKRVGSSYQSQSSAALEGSLERLKSEKQRQLEQSFAATGGKYDYTIENLFNPEINSIQSELDLRKKVTSYDKRYGDTATIKEFGDAITSRALQDYNSAANETNTVLKAISSQLSGSGIFPSKL